MALSNLFTGAASDLGLGGQLADQVQGETEEERRRRLLAMRQRSSYGAPLTDQANPGIGAASALGLGSGYSSLG